LLCYVPCYMRVYMGPADTRLSFLPIDFSNFMPCSVSTHLLLMCAVCSVKLQICQDPELFNVHLAPSCAASVQGVLLLEYALAHHLQG
jgi:hypothetical protein